MEWDEERGALVVDGLSPADFRVLWDYLVHGRAPLIDDVAVYNRFLAAADYLCVRGYVFSNSELKRIFSNSNFF